MIAPLLSAHRSQIKEWDRPALLFPVRASGSQGRLGQQSIEILSFFCFCFDQCRILVEEDATLVPSLCCYYLRERKKGASGLRPALQWTPAAAHRRVLLARMKKADMMKTLFQHESQHQACSICLAIKFNNCNMIMWKNVNSWHIISCVCIINCITIDLIHLYSIFSTVSVSVQNLQDI